MTTTLKKVLKNKEGWRGKKSLRIKEEVVEEGLNPNLSGLLKREYQSGNQWNSQGVA